MLKHFERYSILTTLNHGFRSGYSAETQLLVTMHDLLQANDARVQVDIAILDFSKAFDTVPHDATTQVRRIQNQGKLTSVAQFLPPRETYECCSGR